APRTALAQAADPERVHPVPDGSQAAPHDRPSATPAAHGPDHGRVPGEGGVPGPRDHPAPERVADQGPVNRARPGRLVDLVNRQVPDAPAPVAGSARGDGGFAAPVGDGPLPRTADIRWQDLADDPRYAYPVKRLEEFDPSGAARLRDQVESGTLADRTQFAAALDTALVNRPPLASPHVLRVGERQFTGGFFPGEPLYLSKGGESLVYAYDAGVVKVNYSATGRAVGWASDGWAPERVVAAEATGALEKVAGNRIRRGAVLVTFHGPSQVLAEHVHVLERRWPGRIVNEFVQGGPALDAERGYVLPTLVSTQRRIPGFDGLDNPDLSTGYAEMAENPDTDAHVAANRKWLQLTGPPGFDHELFVTMQRNDSVSRLLVRTAEDPALRAAVRAFAGNAIAYTRATGEIMDLVGNGNVIFPASGSYLLVDALSPSPLPTSAASEALQRLDAREPLTAKDRAILLNVLNYVRTVNALADATGLAERIGIVPPGFDPRSWERLLPALR
ncbi:hypothetical protein, partial [Nonomuraea sp. MG754425]|uniref:hypothetical protein n=1 Tax=Nonomuraea sp. MG754425 TaxID=2570319 RepID=UPI001F30BCD5